MQQTRDVIGKAIISADRGERIGTVGDVLLDVTGACAIGLVVDNGFLQAERVLPYAEVQVLGRDAVIARSGDHTLDAAAWKQSGVAGKRASGMRHRRVITRSGRDVGVLSDVYLDDAGGITSYDLARSDFGGIVKHHTNLPHTTDVALGDDAMIIPDGAADMLERSEQRGTGKT